jgi:serine/threonine protein kinase
VTALARATDVVCCLRCGANISDLPFPGGCAGCLLRAAKPRKVAGFELFGKLGEGGMGEVHLAQHVDAQVPVALKLPKVELSKLPGGAAAFIHEINTVSALVHANIARVQTSGFHEGQPFLVMELLEGGSLRDEANRALYSHPGPALGLLLKIAGAVQFAQRRGVIHCDLKPANILFDAEGTPKVSDFGLARRLSAAGSAQASAIGGGTIGWMAPEQALDGVIVLATDVFSLGVMLYWLVNGELPFGTEEDSRAAYLEKVRRGLAPPTSRWRPTLRAALERVWRRALAYEAEHRYPSAAAFADALQRILDDRPSADSPTPLWGRVWHWSNRHSIAQLLIPAFVAVAVLIFFVLQYRQADELERDALEVNGKMANAQAIAVLFQLQQYGEVIKEAAADSTIGSLLAPALAKDPSAAAQAPSGENPCRDQPPMLDPAPLARYAQRFDTLVVLNTDGCMRARWAHEPNPPGLEKRRFDLRDYFAGARDIAARGQQTVNVRYVYESSISGRVKFGGSVPLWSNGQWIGVLTGSVTVASTLDIPPLKLAETEHRMTVAVGLFEGASGVERLPEAPDFTFLYHRGLSPGQKVTLPPRFTAQLHARFGRRQLPAEAGLQLPLLMDDYVDAIEGDRWLAAFAPIPGTGHFVAVQTRRSYALRASQILGHLALVFSAALVLALLTFGVFFLWNIRRDGTPACAAARAFVESCKEVLARRSRRLLGHRP